MDMHIKTNDEKRYVFFYFNRDDPVKVKQVVPVHVDYWKTANLKGYMGGPFGDRTGGLISFIAQDMDEASKIIMADPFVIENLIAYKWIKEWNIE
jgi:uncharacterized protein